ncbi:hypothetical protein MVEN_01454200 [Mycena venus]|uniref:Uncharacterized protein n=1 Tax=Mycena venus TaxID=2733690 RepID=A0A8H6XUW7_9AGAR|nr:hypothetical protein MVEN_01454200 [Mycena venus]
MQRRIRDLEAQIAQTSSSQARSTPSIPDESIDRPKNASKISMRVIREELGYDKTRWNSFRSYCRDAATSARLNWDGNWKSQRSEKLSMAYNAIEEAFPETRRFQGQWAIDRTVKQCWDNRKNYRNCVKNEKTYRGKEAAARRARRAPSTGTSPSPHRTPTPPRSSGSPTPGPSRPRARPLKPRRISDSDDDDDNDEFIAASDPEAPRDEEAEEEGDEDAGRMSEKAKGKRKASDQGRKNPKRARRE